MRRLTVVVLAVALIACGDGGSDTNDAARQARAPKAPATTLSREARHRAAIEATRRVFDHADKGQWGPSWDLLHPAQQAFVPKDLFVRCRSEAASGINIDEVRILETYDEHIPIPGTTTQTESVAVTVQLTATIGALGKQTDKETVHAIEVNGVWRWTVTDAHATAFKVGKCPE